MKNIKNALSLLYLFLLLFHPGYFCRAENGSSSAEQYSVKLLKDNKEPISSHLLGFNAVYAYEADSVWSDGKIEEYLKSIPVSVMRYPGGTVSSFYHWNALTGEGWKDSWDPQNPVKPKDKSDYMDLNEFISLTRRCHFTPLLGINMSSGRRWNRMEDGIKEALDLMQYCKNQKFNVKYWYLDNEPYQHDSNGGAKTIEEYAGLVNAFATRMKQFDPEIKIIVNWNSAFKNKKEDYRKLLSIAGANIDIVDIHWYWSWNKPTFEKWQEKTPMEIWTGDSYLSEIAYFHQMVKEYGYPNIKLASLEWNVGPIKEKQLTPDQCALIQAEMLMQFMLGGLDMATFWPLQGAGNDLTTRSFVRRSDRTAQPAYPIFRFMGKFQGCSLIKSEETGKQPNMLNLVAVDEKEGSIRVCLLNKNGSDIKTNYETDLFKSCKLIDAQAFVLKNQGKGSEMRAIRLSKHNDAGFSFIAPNTSLTMLTFKKK